MEFDRSRVYTSLTADELRAGDKVIVADTITWLKSNINSNKIYELIEVKNEAYSNRFIVDIGLGVGYALAYLVERKENCTNCGEGKWDAEHKKILCDPIHCGNGNVVLRNHEIEVCEYWKPISKMPKTEQKEDNMWNYEGLPTRQEIGVSDRVVVVIEGYNVVDIGYYDYDLEGWFVEGNRYPVNVYAWQAIKPPRVEE